MITVLKRSALWVFAREFFSAPTSVGAVWPSSSRLAKYLAAQVPLQLQGLVIELGAGTGVVTQALLERGVNPENLVVIERAPAFVQHLKARFPAIRVIQGDASLLGRLIPPGVLVDAIVSSLPLRTLPPREVAGIVEQWRCVLAPEGMVIQFTYGLRRRHGQPMDGFAVHASRIIWWNVPPARVLTFWHFWRTSQSPANNG
ncbi:MAG: class I SAM-dependent methyltransferase [Sulfuricella sp.]